ncbi:YggT family protein [Pelistega ratti]|uniref:YggT family protein n=1 Tax=Pelistega ratti TaxID=2652177 RepID=UPI00135BE4D1|nr:YggT family protein [Pelistega ratti]
MTNALIFLITTFSNLFCIALFLRAWIFWRRISPFNNPYCTFIYQITDFIVVPVRKIIPSSKYLDFPSLLIAYLVGLLQTVLNLLIASTGLFFTLAPFIPIYAVLVFFDNLLSLVLWLSLFYAVMSWISPISPLQNFLRTLIEPILTPIRQMLPNPLKKGPFDFSLLFLMMIIIALQMILKSAYKINIPL